VLCSSWWWLAFEPAQREEFQAANGRTNCDTRSAGLQSSQTSCSFDLTDIPFLLSYSCCLLWQRPVIEIVLLSSSCSYSGSKNALNWVHAAGVVLPARVVQMYLWYICTEHSDKEQNRSPLYAIITPQQVDSKCVCMCWDCCLISLLATNQLVLLLV